MLAEIGKESEVRELRDAALKIGKEKYVLRLYVTGMTSRSLAAVQNTRNICEEYLHERYELEVIDIYQNPDYAKSENLIVAPTLIKKLPLPLRRFIGDMSNREKILVGLDLISVSNEKKS